MKCGSLSHFSLPALFAISILANPELQGGWREEEKTRGGGVYSMQQYIAVTILQLVKIKTIRFLKTMSKFH